MMSGFVPFNKKNHRGYRGGSLRPFNMIDDFFDDTLGEMPFFKRGGLSSGFKVDIKETEKRYTVEAELPGVQKEEIDVKLSEDGELTITVERSEENNYGQADEDNYI